MARILVLEDHPEMSELIAALLEEEGHASDIAPTIADARRLSAASAYDMYTVDVNLPDGKGFDFCRALRQSGVRAPVVMLTTEIGAESVVRGLEAGADDYLRKPIDPAELRARLRGHLARAQGEGLLEFHGLRLDPERRQVTHEGREVALSGRQFDLLRIFMRRPEVVITREKAIESLGRDSEIYDRTIDSHVSQLRKKLRDAGIAGVVISPVYGAGYRLETA